MCIEESKQLEKYLQLRWGNTKRLKCARDPEFSNPSYGTGSKQLEKDLQLRCGNTKRFKCVRDPEVSNPSYGAEATMKRKMTRTTITDLSFDVLKHIMIFVARSLNGAANLASALSVCRMFRELAEDKGILKAVHFHHMKLPVNHGSLWQLRGLVVRCLCARNLTAFETLEKFVKETGASMMAHLIAIRPVRTDFARKRRDLETRYTRSREEAFELSWKRYLKLMNAMDVDVEKCSELLQVIEYVRAKQR